LEVVRELLARGAAVDTTDDDGATPLYIASQEGHLEVVRELLSRGANPRLVTNGGSTALSIATHKGHAAVVQLLTAALAAPWGGGCLIF
jgi:ankyrin repeat protein